MGILNTLEQMFNPSRRPVRMGLKEIVCKPKKKDFIESIRTSATGSEYNNLDGSDRQKAIQKLKAGEKVRLLWDAGETGQKKTIYLVRGGKSQKFSMANCFGRLNDKMAADVIRWLTKENITTSAKVVKIVGGTRKRPKLGCILELSTYRGPKQKG